MIALCQRCVDRISDVYELDPVKNGEICFLCSASDATLYEFTPRMPQRSKQSASAGTQAEREAYEKGRRWA